jgi:hypothetical protein
LLTTGTKIEHWQAIWSIKIMQLLIKRLDRTKIHCLQIWLMIFLPNKIAQNTALNWWEAILSYLKKCPHCAELMHVRTKVCSNCWYDFRKDPAGLPPEYGLQNGFVVVAFVMVPIFVLATLAISVGRDKPEAGAPAQRIAGQG